ncbi:MAG: permease [Bacillota bacterium]
MELIKILWDFLQDELLGMAWLHRGMTTILEGIGVDTSSKIGGSLHFFLYDMIKITILLCTLIFLISYIQSYFPPERSKQILGKFKGIQANIVSALLGTVTPFCSCSSIPLFMGFTSAGLPLGVTFSFLISSPMVDLASLALLMGIFGAEVAIIYVVFGLIVAVVGGTFIEQWGRKQGIENLVESYVLSAGSINVESPDLTKNDRCNFAKEQVMETLKKVFPYIVVGVGIGAFIHQWIPEEVIESVLGSHNPFGVILATICGIPMYADIFGTIPVAEALLGKGAELGTILAFMMAVTTLSLPSLIMLKKAVKPKLLSVFVGICTFGIVAVGYLFNYLQEFLI